MLSYIIFGFTFAFAAAVQPGPLLTYLISQTLSKGWKHTLPAAFAPIISDGPIIILVLLLLNQIPLWFVKFLHFGGALFLFYLAFGSYKSWKKFDMTVPTETKTSQTLMNATLVNVLNPAPYLGWSLVMGPLFLKGYSETPLNGISLIVSFYVTLILCLMGIIFLFAYAKNIGPRVNRITLGFSVIALIGFGIYQLWMGIIS
ncbi:MAG: LysE family transporter [Ignavibacteriales bacterium]|nr:LysE family transporter [Ignavibacteriales bacterium]